MYVASGNAPLIVHQLSLVVLSLTAGFMLGHNLNQQFYDPNPEESVYNYISFDVKPERRADFLKSINANEHDTLTLEPAAQAYRWGEDLNVPNRFHFHEEYTGTLPTASGFPSGFQAHLDSDHMAQWNAFVATDPFSAEPNGPRLFKKMDKMRRGQMFF